MEIEMVSLENGQKSTRNIARNTCRLPWICPRVAAFTLSPLLYAEWIQLVKPLVPLLCYRPPILPQPSPTWRWSTWLILTRLMF